MTGDAWCLIAVTFLCQILDIFGELKEKTLTFFIHMSCLHFESE